VWVRESCPSSTYPSIYSHSYSEMLLLRYYLSFPVVILLRIAEPIKILNPYQAMNLINIK
jgi:hypothetical protein